MPPARKLLAGCLTGVLVCLLLVGTVSSTFVRHVIQVVPIVLALVALRRGAKIAPYFALPIFAIWLLLMVLIWLYLLGIATFFSGSFSAVEVLLTVLIGSFSAAGIVACMRASSPAPVGRRVAAAVGFGIMQAAAMGLSFMPAFANT